MKEYTPHRDTFFINRSKGKKVLHLGAADWPYTKEKLQKGSLLYTKLDSVVKEQLGVDINKESVKYLKGINTKRSSIIYFDLNREGDISFDPDIVIFGETLEHINNLGIALTNIKKLMNDKTELLISVPNALDFSNILLAFLGHEHQHPDHKVAFTYKTITQLLDYNGFDLVEVKFTWLFKYPSEVNWKGKILYLLPRLISRLFPLFAGNIIVVAKKKGV